MRMHACIVTRAEQSKVLTRFSQRAKCSQGSHSEQRRAKCSQGVPAVEGMGQRLLLLGCHLQAAFAF